MNDLSQCPQKYYFHHFNSLIILTFPKSVSFDAQYYLKKRRSSVATMTKGSCSEMVGFKKWWLNCKCFTMKNTGVSCFQNPKMPSDIGLAKEDSSKNRLSLTLSGVRSGMTLCSEGGQFDHNIFYAI